MPYFCRPSHINFDEIYFSYASHTLASFLSELTCVPHLSLLTAQGVNLCSYHNVMASLHL